MNPLKKAHVKPLEGQKILDEMHISEIIGRPAHQTRQRLIPHFPDGIPEPVRPYSLIDRLKELVRNK